VKTFQCLRCRTTYTLRAGRPVHVCASGPMAGAVVYDQQATHAPVLDPSDTLDVMREACGQLGLRPAYRGEVETCIVLVSFEGHRLKVAATDAPETASVPVIDVAPPCAHSVPGRRLPSPLLAALYDDCVGGWRRS
jgi:hypothetical protein